jgi:hypothetical protein
MLRLICLLPASLTDTQRLLATAWLRRHVQEHHWPKEYLSVTTQAVNGEAELMTLLDQSPDQSNEQLSQHFKQNVTDQLFMVLAADSLLDEECVYQMQARLFTSRNRRGVVPGEGAAVLWLGRNGMKLVPSVEPDSISVLGRCARGMREKSAETANQVDANTLSELSRHAFEIAGLDATAIQQVVTDVDHRGRRLGEVIDFASQLQQDSSAMRVASVGSSMGYAGAVGTLAALVAAHYACIEENQPVLFAAALGAIERAVAIIARPAPTSAVSAAAVPA